MKKFYLREEKRNEQEKKTGNASYYTLVKRYCNNCILCNEVPNIDDTIFDNIVIGSIYDDELDEYDEVYQYYIVDINDWEIESLKETQGAEESIIIAYSEVLQNYVLLVTHFGTSWDYVNTQVPLSNNIEECI